MYLICKCICIVNHVLSLNYVSHLHLSNLHRCIKLLWYTRINTIPHAFPPILHPSSQAVRLYFISASTIIILNSKSQQSKLFFILRCETSVTWKTLRWTLYLHKTPKASVCFFSGTTDSNSTIMLTNTWLL